MAYTVLARKYRPQTFQELVGQEHVARTLANAIASGRVAHAFLFTGVRGVGKTTTARLLAKSLDCAEGPTATPCNQCPQCTEITAGVDMDVLEIDGASNNSVDDVRRLQETLPYRPARDRFKIVIVDEVHMLSTGAFNAFLKTLEEPPPHVKFIFATTESHKVPITIRSRCQRYDFRLIPQTVIAGRVREILAAEGIRADDDAIAIVAREAAGSMRDALTLLDQIVAFAGDSLEGEEVARVLGIAGRANVFAAARATLGGDGAAVLRAVDALASQGVDMLHFARQLLDLLRDMIVLRVAGGDGDLVDMVEDERRDAVAIAESVDLLELERSFAALSKLVDDVAKSGTPKTVLEMGLVRIATRPALRSVAELVARLEELERRLEGGGGAAGVRGGGGGGPRGGGSRPSPESSGPRVHGRTVDRSASAAVPSSAPSADVRAPKVDAIVLAGTMMSRWERIVGWLSEHKPALGAIVEHAVPKEVGPDRLVLGFAEGSFYAHQARSVESSEGLAAATLDVLGKKLAIEVIDANIDEPTVAAMAEKRREDQREQRRKEALEHPAVVEALKVFPEMAQQVEVSVED